MSGAHPDGSSAPRVDAGAQSSGRLLLLCTTTRACPEALARALDLSQELSVGLLAVFILDPALLSETSSRLEQAGFDASRRDGAALAPAYAKRADERLEAISRAAQALGITVETQVLEGAFAAQLRGLVERATPVRLVAPRKRRSHYARSIFEHRLLEPVKELLSVDEVEEG